MDARLQRRIQRYGWDVASSTYESLWHAQLAQAQARMLAYAAPARGERVLDIACGTGRVAFDVAKKVGAGGRVVGVDISERMVELAAARARERQAGNVEFVRMDGETLAFPDASFDVVLCAFGLMYMPSPEDAMREMRRVLRPGGRVAIAVWGDRSACGWSDVFPIVDAEVSSEVCPLFFRLGRDGALAGLCTDAGFETPRHCRFSTTLDYVDVDEACDAAFVGGPVALAWSRFGKDVRARVRERYAASIEPWRSGESYRVPGEFVVAAAVAPRRHRISSI